MHPLATASLVLGMAGLAVPIVAGLTGAVLGAFARRFIAAAPDRWEGGSRASIGVLVGLFTGAVPLAAIAVLRRDELGLAPVLAVLAYVAVVVVVAGPALAGGRAGEGTGPDPGPRPGAGPGPGAGRARSAAVVLAAVAGAVVVLVVVIVMLQSVIRAIGDEIGETACRSIG